MPSCDMTGKSKKKLLWSVYLLSLCAWMMDAPLLAQSDTTEKQSDFGLVASLDIRSTRLQGRLANINGAVAGVHFGERGHLLVLGYYRLGYDAPTRYVVWRGLLPRRIDLDYFTSVDAQFVSLGYWYPIFRSSKWFVAAPLEIGYGGETSRYRASISPEPGTSRFQLAQVGAYGSYRFVSWLGVTARVGYRSVLFDPEFSQRFSGMYYGYGLAAYPVPAFYAFRDWRRKRMKEKSSH